MNSVFVDTEACIIETGLYFYQVFVSGVRSSKKNLCTSIGITEHNWNPTQAHALCMPDGEQLLSKSHILY